MEQNSIANESMNKRYVLHARELEREKEKIREKIDSEKTIVENLLHDLNTFEFSNIKI
mgnify:CR=1 FL=1